MGIQLDDFDKRIIVSLAQCKDRGDSIYPYLFGYIASSIDAFVCGHSLKSDLESTWATVKLVELLAKTNNAEELREIASGTREVPGEDVESGR